MSILYERITALREKNGISEYRLCKDAGMPLNTFTSLKKGKNQSLSAKNMDKIASYFGVTVSYLLGTSDDPHGNAVPEVAMPKVVTEDDLKIGMLGGTDITDAKWNEIKAVVRTMYRAAKEERNK